MDTPGATAHTIDYGALLDGIPVNLLTPQQLVTYFLRAVNTFRSLGAQTAIMQPLRLRYDRPQNLWIVPREVVDYGDISPDTQVAPIIYMPPAIERDSFALLVTPEGQVMQEVAEFGQEVADLNDGTGPKAKAVQCTLTILDDAALEALLTVKPDNLLFALHGMTSLVTKELDRLARLRTYVQQAQDTIGHLRDRLSPSNHR